MQRLKKILLRLFAVLAIIYLLLLIPDSAGKPEETPAEKPFAWNRDEVWNQLEQQFQEVRQRKGPVTDTTINMLIKKAEEKLTALNDSTIAPGDKRFMELEENFFALIPFIAAVQNQNNWCIDYYNRVRNRVKQLSRGWDMNTKKARNTVYQVLYGMRAATEELLLQSTYPFNPVMTGKEVASATPATKIFGITVHSGDLLVSRGGAEVSALISRGNNYPGNFSHVALIYINPTTNTPYLIEAHIEKGVAIATVDEYVKDKKLRFMVLRLRSDLPALVKNPMLPQEAAQLAYDETLKRHIPYDFKMNFRDSSALFCSEVASYAYNKKGIQLWQAISTISSQGVINWLHAFGVENFVTQMPSDLEYDPQLSVVAEWREPETLFKDHVDNAVMDVLLTSADKGATITYNRWMLPIARVIKGYSMIQNKFGKPGTVPEGMSATQALKNNSFVSMHVQLKAATQQRIDQFIKDKGYRPPYWQLIKLAEESKKGGG
jgi:Permuted papain-like amidase enzyme, YaeF/YiiX, C92 family